MSSIRAATVLILLALLGCERSAIPSNTDNVTDDSMATYLALGDSYTIGEGVAEQDRWPVVLGKSMSLETKIVARTGWTVNELDAGIDAQTNPDDTYGVVTLLIGVNDEFRGGDVDQYRVDFERILGRAIEFGAGDASRVTVVSIPDYGVTPAFRSRDGISERIDAFNAAARGIVEARNMRWVDVTDISRQMPDAVVADGLHPNAEQYRAWATRITQRLSEQ